MPKLNQMIAVVAGEKSQAREELTKAHNHRLKPEGLNGLFRTYKRFKHTWEPGGSIRPRLEYDPHSQNICRA